MECDYTCPHCWEIVTLLVDVSVDGWHQFVEDCEVCCNPLDFRVRVRDQDVLSLEVDAAQ